MTAAEFYRKYIGMDGRSVFSKEQLEVVNALNEWRKEYAKECAGLAFDAAIEWHESDVERDAHQENIHQNKEQYLKETFK